MQQPENSAAGYSYAVAAYTFWGIAPIYFMAVAFAAPLEILANRIAWSIPLLAALVLIGRQWRTVLTLDRRAFAGLALCAVLLSVNWLTFIYGILAGRIAETSLGYFLNPLVSIALGTLLLRERMRPWQWTAVALAGFGIGFELATVGSLPWVALVLALTFGLYGLVRKKLMLPAALSLGIETLYLLPLALGFLYLAELPAHTTREQGLLALGGVITVLPLVWFGAAAVRLKLTTLGFIQYLAPSLSLVIAVWLYGEQITPVRWFSFGMVWLSILLYSAEGLWWQRRALGGVRV
ncbi:MAG: EamA family transporter RarD [Pseudomonadales bacterium]